MAVKKRRGPDPIVIPKKVSEWIHSGTNAYVNNYKKGGGKKQK